jgi:hypothetical protein
LEQKPNFGAAPKKQEGRSRLVSPKHSFLNESSESLHTAHRVRIALQVAKHTLALCILVPLDSPDLWPSQHSPPVCPDQQLLYMASKMYAAL